MRLYSERAYAKINLSLEIIGRRSDGYHELVSLVAFAHQVFDVVTIKPSAHLSLDVSGPSAHYIDGENLILLAAERAAKLQEVAQLGHIELIKNIPVAAGLGGGSADAAAVLRAVGKLNKIPDIQSAFNSFCVALGADVPVCLGSGSAQGAFMWGLGEQVWRPAETDNNLLPHGISAVLANPKMPVATGDIFKALDAKLLKTKSEPPVRLAPFKTSDNLLKFLHSSRNDLEKPALTFMPVIEDVLSAIRALPHCQLARMSGSGATCFGLFKNFAHAKAAKQQLSQQQPNWWLAATRLG